MNRKRSFRPAAAGLTLLALFLGGCSASSGTAASQESVEPGSSKEEYAAALAGMEPVTLTMQLPSAPKSTTSAPNEAYAAAVEEWSGGKIKFDILYANSRVTINEMNAALADGLVDSGMHMPVTEPESFPANTLAGDLMFLQESTPLAGSMQLVSSWIEFGAQQEAISNELEEYGIQPLLPLLPTSGTSLLCNGQAVTSLGEAKGKQIRAGAPSNVPAIEVLGATAVSLPVAEVYQGLQRGVVDCAAGNAVLANTVGLFEVTTDWTLDPEVQLAGTSMSFGFNKDRWDSLPLAARQLLWDRLDGYIEQHLATTVIKQTGEAIGVANKAGVKFHEWAPDARDAIKAHLNSFLEEAPGQAPKDVDGAAFVEAAKTANDRWKTIITEDLGFKDDTAWSELDSWISENELDVSPLSDRLMEEALLPHRPAA
ncbi:TRAP transporter substrate-binding protein DctP [Arthrobacter sp. I2-34]|uniref:TRAP transporter substrate-binding protein DctP n=1 Tax=Arthrobacter hankyongi TaxID=2904801 RepID=A0ABS9L463_9MICC|nr:TRAP transporter substrate-binding protein DctP [Arthrobacter hankyongi]MCG2621284.1 TRAP transporter substrate-binding protein DctP [Arthrobacter hankyongi]